MFIILLTSSRKNAIIMNIKIITRTIKMTERITKHDPIAKQREALFNSIYGSNKMSDILEDFREDYSRWRNISVEKVQALYKKYSYAIFYMYSPSSIRNNLVKFKNVIKEEGGRYQANALEAFTIDEVYKPLKKKDRERKRKAKESVRAGEADAQNIDPYIVIEKIKELRAILTEKAYTVKGNQKEDRVRSYYILAMLGLATGRRFTELLKTLEVSRRGEKVFFDGLLKGNNKKIEGHIIELSYAEVKGYLRELRKTIDTDLEEKELKTEKQKHRAINQKYSKIFNNAIKRILNYNHVKDLRHNYAIAGSQLFSREGETVEDTITRILGHNEVFTSALSYV